MTHYYHSETNIIGTLTSAITATQTTGIKIEFIDRITGEAREPDSKTRLFVIEKGSEQFPSENYELIYSPNGYSIVGAIMTLADGVIRGLAFSGGDLLTAVTANKKSHAAGAEVGISNNHYLHTIAAEIFAGNKDTGGNEFIIGDGTNTNNTYSYKDAGGNKGIIRKNHSTGKAQFSNDGSVWSNLDTVGAHGTLANLKDHTDVAATASDSPSGGDLFVYDPTNKWENQTVATVIGSVIQNSTYIYAADAEASDTYVITLAPAPTAYAAGQVFHFKANTANTGAATLNVNALGAKTIKKDHDKDLETGDIESGQIVTVVYDGTNMQMQSQKASDMTTANKTTLTDGSNADALHVHGYSLMLGTNRTQITVANTTTETTLASVSVPGGTLSTTNAIRIRIPLIIYSAAAGGSATCRLKYGSTTVATVSVPGPIGAFTNGKGYIISELLADAATGAQAGTIEMNVGGDDMVTDDHTYNEVVQGNATEDSTSTLTISVTWQWTGADVQNIIIADNTIIEAIRT